MQSIGDSTFGVKRQARAVLAYLDDREPDFATYKDGFYDVRFETRPWYNGRERGLVVSMWSPVMAKFGAIHIAVFEHRNSDSICTLFWETDGPYWNGPVADQETLDLAYGKGDKWHVAARFSPGEAGAAAAWIYETFEMFYQRKAEPTAVLEEGGMTHLR